MRDYGTVHSTFWTSPTTHDLSGEAKLLALYLLTGPHTTALGCFRLPDGYVMEDLGWSPETVSKAFMELFDKGFSNRCETTKWVLISNYLKWNPPDNPNQVKSLRKLAAQVPESASILNALLSMLSDTCGPENQVELFPASDKPLPNGSKTLSKPEYEYEQEQTQIQEQIHNRKNISSEPSGPSPVICFPTNTGKQFPITQEQVDRFAELYPTVEVLPELRKAVAWCETNPTRRKTARGMLAFVNRWLSTVHDEGRGTKRPAARPGVKPMTATERMRAKSSK